MATDTTTSLLLASTAFQPGALSTAILPVGPTSANRALSFGAGQVRLVNTGSTGARIAFGLSSSIAAVTPTPGTLGGGTYTGGALGSLLIPAGAIEVLTPPPNTTHIAAITDSGTTTLEITTGAGV